MMPLNLFFDIPGMIIAFVFIWLNMRSSRSLIGSFFKTYYRWMIVGSIILSIAFISEIVGGYIGLSAMMTEIVHYTSLLVSSVIFISASYILPKEAARYLENK